MKNIALIVLTLLLACSWFATPCAAVPLGSANHSGDYLLGTGLPGALRFGFYGSDTERDVEFNGISLPLASQRVMTYLGFDIKNWLTIHGAAGVAQHTFTGFGVNNSDYEFDYEFGISLGLIDYYIPDPTLFEDRLRLHANGTYNRTSGKLFSEESTSWGESSFSLILSLVNDIDRNVFLNPNSISLYAGPMLSFIHCDEFDAKTPIGLVAGIEVNFTESVTMDLGVRQFEDTGFAGGIHLTF